MQTRKILGFKTYRVPDNHRDSHGKNTIITELGKINIICLDDPDDALIEERIREVLREQEHGEDFDDDCPLCQQMRGQPHDVVYFKQDLDEKESW